MKIFADLSESAGLQFTVGRLAVSRKFFENAESHADIRLFSAGMMRGTFYDAGVHIPCLLLSATVEGSQSD
ncbi:hypothetical protein GCWU000342_01727 [Shuttleworthella satelles DSM 14600]|uniref:Uncharacterized protein n=1 Tax=Shuttleworthella satelles DSM 14600 TaxID=626523 RepID=C4GCN3_9FIRM|nr:hypothetical protein GCWU000342_01727 [Shuttleworthia satelles DSM 14600]